MTLVLATCANLPELASDDQHLYQALKETGTPVEVAVWDDPSVDWSQYAMCVIRSTWDYVPKRAAYVLWAERVATQTVLWNPAPLIEWNTDKVYLKALENQGIPIVETEWISKGSSIDVSALLHAKNWNEVVIKPVISASGKDTFRVTQHLLPNLEAEIQALLAQRDLMVQPFMPSVTGIGELSFLFFNDQFSHAVAKVPASGEFRVQEQFGGTTRVFQPSETQRVFAENVLHQLPWPTLYARVDVMVGAHDQLYLSELELTEPSMYLAYDAKAAHRFAQAIQQRLNDRIN